MWSIDYVQVPVDEKIANCINQEDNDEKNEKSPNNMLARPTPIHHRLVKQINVSSDSGGSLIKSGSESSLSEDSNVRRGSLQRNGSGEGGSTKEWKNEQEDEKETCSDTEECVAPVPNARRRRSRVHATFRKSEGVNVM